MKLSFSFLFLHHREKRTKSSQFGSSSTSIASEEEKHRLFDPSDSDDAPLFSFKSSLLNERDRIALSKFADWGLGEDPSSAHFMLRKKAIVYVMMIDGQVYCLQRNNFHQSQKYNDFSGGYKRYYSTLPENLVQDHLADVIKEFVQTYNLPNYACILLQLQRSLTPGTSFLEIFHPIFGISSEKNRNAADITGQGIHTDGADRAGIICIDRVNVEGAENALYADLEGKDELFSSSVLKEGDALFFKDNSLYHSVSDAKPIDPKKDLKRTVVIMHYPGLHYLTGNDNASNLLKRRSSEIKLRDLDSSNEFTSQK